MYKFFKKFILFYIVWAIFFSLVNKAKADLNYNTYYGTGAYPTFPGNGGTLTYPTIRSSGTVATINHNQNGNEIRNYEINPSGGGINNQIDIKQST